MVSGYQEPVGGTSSPSTGTAIGSKSIRAILRMFKGIDISLEAAYGTDFIPTIDTPIQVTANRLRLANPAQTFYTSFESPAITANQFVKLPTITTTESSIRKDEAVLLKQSQEIKNKNIDINPASTDENIIYDDDADTTHMATFDVNGKLVKTLISSLPVIAPADNSITDAKIAAHTSTKITITNHAQLPSDAVYTTGSQTITSKTFNSLNNVFSNLGVYKYQIFKVGSNYYCRDNLSGVAVAFGTDPVPVLRYPLLNGGDSYVHGADYTLPTGYTTYLDFPVETLYCSYHMAPDARLMVPQGFTGTVVRFKNTTIAHCTGNKLIGGIIRESGTVERNWTAILFECTGGEVASKGVFANKVQFTSIWDALHGVRFNADATSTTGFNTSNYCENLFIYRCKGDFVGFNMDVAYTTSPNVNGSHRNRFNNCLLQSSGLTTEENCVAVNNVMGRENTFIGVYAADFNGKNKTCVIHADSDSTIIEGGSLTVPTNTTHDPVQPRYEDNSTLQNTKIRDMYRHNQISRITPGIGGNAMEIVPWTGQTTNTFSWWDASKFERFYFQKTTSDYKFVVNRSNASGALRPAVWQMIDTAAGTPAVESFRMETDGSLRVAPGKFKLRDSNDTHDITITVPNNAANYNLAIPTLTGNDTLVTVATAGAASVAALDDVGDVTLTSVAAYDIPYRNAGNTAWENLPKGTNSRLLSINTSGVVGWNFLGNANVLAHTSTQITITNKAQLNSQIAYKDETGWLTETMMSGNAMQLIKGPVRGKKTGGFYGLGSAQGAGMMTAIISATVGTGTSSGVTMDTDHGPYYKYTTGNVSGNIAGHKGVSPVSIRKFNPIFAVKARPSHATNNRLYAGLSSTSTDIPAGDEPLANLSGIMVVQRSTDTNYWVASNDGTNAVSIYADTGVAVSTTSPITIFFRADETNSKWQWSLDQNTWTDVATRFPGSTTSLFYINEIQTVEGFAHVLHAFTTEIVSDK